MAPSVVALSLMEPWERLRLCRFWGIKSPLGKCPQELAAEIRAKEELFKSAIDRRLNCEKGKNRN